MEAYANALLIAIPAFMVLMLTELIYGYATGKQTYVFMDTISSLSSGLTNILKDTLGLVVILISYPWLSQQLAITQIEADLWLYLTAFICIDFASYWSHRLNHKINFFWNQHIIHHSSEEFNMACALRQSISNIIGYGALFMIPAAVLGIPQEVIAILAPLHLFGQFWYHTQHIGKLGWLEYIIVTPSQHRVHHAINPTYIDKNLSAVFCVWDRMFGTFQEELDDEPPVYGVLKPVQSWNPLWINFQHLWGLALDAWHTKQWRDKFRLWLMPTGWRPEDVKQSHPKTVIADVTNNKNMHPTTIAPSHTGHCFTFARPWGCCCCCSTILGTCPLCMPLPLAWPCLLPFLDTPVCWINTSGVSDLSGFESPSHLLYFNGYYQPFRLFFTGLGWAIWSFPVWP
jgi:sterol desaturase/sphingolipid hydroxylase (fatty acid hydroxylase superfamily)